MERSKEHSHPDCLTQVKDGISAKKKQIGANCAGLTTDTCQIISKGRVVKPSKAAPAPGSGQNTLVDADRNQIGSQLPQAGDGWIQNMLSSKEHAGSADPYVCSRYAKKRRARGWPYPTSNLVKQLSQHQQL